MDPIRDAQYDEQKAAELRWEEKSESNPGVRKNLERVAQDFDAEATELRDEVAAANEPETESEQ